MRNHKYTKRLVIGLLLLLSVQAQFLKNASNNHESQRSDIRLLQSSVSIKPSEVSSFAPTHITFNGIAQPQDITKIELFNSLSTIQLEIVKRYSNSVLVKLERGSQGRFRGRITFTDESYIETINKIDINAKIDSIYPMQGNYQGGVLLTIQGSRFGNLDSDTEVLIGEVPCAIITYNDSQIECVTQPAWKLMNQKRNLVLKRKSVVISSDTPLNTEFTFISVKQQPIINRILSSSGQIYRGSTVNIEGTNLFAENLQTQLFIGNDKISFQRTETGLSFVVPQIITNQANYLIVFVDQNGSTKPEQLQILYSLTQIYCLNPDNTLQIQGWSTYLTAQIQGLTDQSIVQIVTSDDKYYVADIVTQNYMQITQMPTVSQIQMINVDGQNILQSPIKLIQNNAQVSLNFLINTHPADSKYFQMKLIQQNQNPNLIVKNLLIRIKSVQFTDELTQEDTNTFKYKKFSFIQNDVDFYVCTNQGSFIYTYNGNQQDINLTPTIQMLTQNKNPKAGDIFQFNITSSTSNLISKKYGYAMKIICQNGYKYQYYNNYLDYYYSLSSQQNGTVYNFVFPTIMQRLNPQKETCDISIEIINVQSNLIKEYRDEFESSQFISSFLKELNTNIDDFNFRDIGKQIKSTTLISFEDAVTPTRQRIYVETFSPSVISSYGSEQIIITGNNFLLNGNAIDNIAVKLLGVSCEVQSVNNTQIVCISGPKTRIDPLEKTQVMIGNSEALLLSHVAYSIDLKENTQLEKYFVNGYKINVPYNYVLNVDLGKFQGDELNFFYVNVNEQLIFRSYRDLNVTFKMFQGLGQISFGTIDQRFNSNCKIFINQQNDVKLSSYGKNIENYSYTLVNSLETQQNLIEVQESQVQLKKGNKIMVLATTQEERNEEYIVESVKYNKIYLSTNIQTRHQNTQETINYKNGDSYLFSVQVPIIQIDRNIQIEGFQLQFQDLYDTKVVANMYDSNNVIQSFIKLNKDTNISYRNMTSSVLQSNFKHLAFGRENIKNIFISENNQCKITLTKSGKFNNNFSQCNVQILNTNDKNLTNEVQEMQNNIFATTQTCLNVRYPYKLVMKDNVCLSVQYFTNFFYLHTIQSEGIAFVALDIRQALVLYQFDPTQEVSHEVFSVQPQQSNNTKILIAANSVKNQNKNTPALFINNIPLNYYSMFNFYNFELIGFNENSTPIQYQYVDNQNNANQNFISICDFYNFKSDTFNQTMLFNDTNSDLQKGLALIDKDGSLTGKVQSILSSNIVRPDLNCQMNEQKLQSCSPLIGVMSINPDVDYYCKNIKNADLKVIPSETQFIPNITQTTQVFVTQLQQTFSFRFVKKLTGEEFIPCRFNLQQRYLADSNLGFIAKYSVDTKNISSITIYKYQWQFIQTSASNKELEVANCSHGDYFIQPDGIQICIKSEKGNFFKIVVSIQSKI
ncbi:IPT/TIG domain protein (macronuclear) [Tetrahymena thermophila SB210]|uniref:IPT/TIG domain protein n=1 Tax=Tetrahymena thermophila (strain SB210) TaxID=312017 RepID=Q24FJ9_TETTS|nr:IPT/TIG domain protein [Tetrahymena thermophila SB210]EAS06551.2 IPT/TIG domain protein [Tetrahymena thermophila SB210]|eukprot:XP_001026796.2 IPT/TIG domain protein [Tetrahymena thermophila SB210]